MAKVCRRVYVSVGEVRSLTNYLYIPKGEDIGMVYNGTSSGLNKALRTPHFDLLTMVFTLRAVEGGGIKLRMSA